MHGVWRKGAKPEQRPCSFQQLKDCEEGKP